jgi:hypothetical protein
MPAFPLKLSANRRYLVDQNNKPFLMAGDSPQGLMGLLSPQEVEKYFADRQAHGFNTAGWVDVACAGRDFPDNTTAGTYDGVLPFTGYVAGGNDFTHYDLSKPNEAYFVRLDHAIESAARHGIFVFIDPAETIGWLATLRNNGLDASYAYGQYLGHRYGKYKNIGWLSGNDFQRWRIPADDALALAVAKGIQSVAPEQLQTVEINYNTSSSLDDQAWAPLISLNGTYTYAATYIQVLHSYNQAPVMPAYLQEAHYDLEEVGTPTDYGTPEVLRRQEYWTMLSGGSGQFYGNRYTWSFTPGWDSYLDTLGVKQMEIWKDFFVSLPWQDLVPERAESEPKRLRYRCQDAGRSVCRHLYADVAHCNCRYVAPAGSGACRMARPNKWRAQSDYWRALPQLWIAGVYAAKAEPCARRRLGASIAFFRFSEEVRAPDREAARSVTASTLKAELAK